MYVGFADHDCCRVGCSFGVVCLLASSIREDVLSLSSVRLSVSKAMQWSSYSRLPKGKQWRLQSTMAMASSAQKRRIVALLAIFVAVVPVVSGFVAPGGLSRPAQCVSSQHYSALSSSSTPESNNNDDGSSLSIWEDIASSLSGTFAASKNKGGGAASADPSSTQLVTLVRVGIPSIFAALVATLAFPSISLGLASIFNDAGVFAVLSQDSSQFVQNFLTVSSLMFSILVGQTYYFMYSQQEAIYYALFDEVTEAKSLLEQVALVCQGRAMYNQVLRSISTYVQDDLKQLNADPAVLLSARPVDDPLEAIMYMTSVGVPSSVYETVRSLRQARAHRLGALQRKLPRIHMLLLWILAAIELCSFPLLGAGTQTIGGYNILTVEGVLFGIMTFGIVMTLRVVGELWRPAGGAYNVDAVLRVMVRGLEQELDERMSGKRSNFKAPLYGMQALGPDDGMVIGEIMDAESVPAEQ